MKKILYVFAVAAAIAAVDMQAQPKSRQAAKAAVEKAEAATVNPKQNVKPATWIKYGKTLMDAYSFSKGNVWVGMSRQELFGRHGEAGVRGDCSVERQHLYQGGIFTQELLFLT